MQGLAYDKWPLPWRGQLMHVRGAVYESENEVSFSENTRADLPAVVAAEVLQVWWN